MNPFHRKYFHILSTSPFIFFSFFMDSFVSRKIYIILSLVMLTLFLLYEYFRIYNHSFRQKIMERFSYLYKDKERNKIAGSIWGPVDLLILALFFSKPTVVATLCVGCLSDPIAAIFGMKYGKRKNKFGKTLIGSVAFFVSTLLFVSLALFIIKDGSLSLVWILALSLFATAMEAYLPFGDDNFVVPMGFALAAELIVRFF